MSKLWITVVVGVIVVLASCNGRTTIRFVPCPDGSATAATEKTSYDLEKGKRVDFVNDSGVPVELRLQGCDLLVGDPTTIGLAVGETKTYKVKTSATGGAECVTLLIPDCGQGGPVMIPYP